jgi:hypothetical protein
MALLPQYSPYSEPLGVLICGGSTPSYHYALDNCVSTQPEVANPVWAIERMVIIFILNQGKYLINPTSSLPGVLCPAWPAYLTALTSS